MIRLLDITNSQIATKVLKVQKPAYQVEAKIIGFDEIPPLRDTVESLQTSKEKFYGYYQEDSIVGVIGFQLFEKVLDVHRLVVHPHYFRQGIGRRLLQYVLDEYDDQVSCFKVHTGTKNDPAKMLYKSLGFKEVEQILVSPTLSLSMLERKSEKPQKRT
ncbi:GNAT family N-acetyltransferase [Shimazuella kribbensis]|uniref:GNAT family N-acetyltransferase n=1 Tax=Shimazuella kribbensis TaxID=139808 RepID=UPI0004049B50|nr:GNAT family N-acetyltransferase [Shimazuella kribbensis]